RPLNVGALDGAAGSVVEKPVRHGGLLRALEELLREDDKSASQETAGGSPQVANASPWRNARMMEIEGLLRQVGLSDVPVLLLGETGVGKEVLARQLHSQSTRAQNQFLKLNCAALPSELVESELFGYQRGAFTGAFRDTPGKFEQAQGGIILLDEVGDMDVRLQAKLLQVLQDGEFQRLGSGETVKVNVRVMAATHRDLRKAIREGNFREDLFYRLNIMKIEIPPLRERKDEIPCLAEHFLQKHAERGNPIPEVTPMLRQALADHDWPGNV